MRRVVISGMGVVSALGDGLPGLVEGLLAGRSAVRRMPDWTGCAGLRSLVGAPLELKNEKAIPRQSRRSMGRLSLFAVQAAEQALDDAAFDRARLGGGRVGCVIGSTMGSAQSLSEAFEIMIRERDLALLHSMQFFKCLSHTAAMNVSQHLGIAGAVTATCAACVSALQAVGLGLDLIRSGRQDAVLCGGSEELHPTVTASFDILRATSTGFNDAPGQTPRPFDRRRDGLVCGEGCGLLLLEAEETARARGVRPWAEVLGYSSCASGVHVSQSDRLALETCMAGALADGGLAPGDVDLVSAHATGTLQGDAEEAGAIATLFGPHTPVSALKGCLGHTMGACGTLELAATLAMMRGGRLCSNRNFEEPGEGCEGIGHLREPLARELKVVIKNASAFGGLNAALVCRLLDR